MLELAALTETMWALLIIETLDSLIEGDRFTGAIG